MRSSVPLRTSSLSSCIRKGEASTALCGCQMSKSDDHHRVDLYEVTQKHHRYPNHHIRRFVIAEQRHLRSFDDRDVFVAPIVDDVDRYLANLLRPCACRTERSAEIAECQTRLHHKITMANELAIQIFKLLTRDEY